MRFSKISITKKGVHPEDPEMTAEGTRPPEIMTHEHVAIVKAYARDQRLTPPGTIAPGLTFGEIVYL